MPQEEDVLEDFGFNNFVSYGDRTHLLGVYIGLYLSSEVSAEDMHEWRVGGTLISKIKEFYFKIPESSRRGYFPWYLRNLDALERPMTKDEAKQRMFATFFDKARPYLDIEDQKKAASDLKPEAKKSSYFLLAEIIQWGSPNPAETNWYSFGFATCRGRGEESILVNLYQLLVTKSDGSQSYDFYNSQRSDSQPVTFTQFWKAHEAGTLIELMDSKGLTNLRSRLPFLEGFLTAPPAGPRPSVWNLRQFLEVNDPIAYPPIPSINVDYGFINCRNFEETCTLMEIYRKILETANPLGLHQACIAGELYLFASDYVRMNEQWRPLMKNFYP